MPSLTSASAARRGRGSAGYKENVTIATRFPEEQTGSAGEEREVRCRNASSTCGWRGMIRCWFERLGSMVALAWTETRPMMSAGEKPSK